jgi:hypothetical protein
VAEAAQKQTRADQEHESQRHLRGQQGGAQEAPARGDVARAAAQRRSEIRAARLPGGRAAGERCDDHRRRAGEAEHARIHDGAGRHPMREQERPHHRAAPQRDEQARGATGQGQHQALDHQLPHQAASTRPETGAHRHLRAAPHPAGEQQVRHVRTGDEEHREGHQTHPERDLRVARHLRPARRLDRPEHHRVQRVPRPVGGRRRPPVGQIGLGGRRRRRDPGREPREDREPEPPPVLQRLGTRQQRGRLLDGKPEVGRLEVGPREARRRDADHRVRELPDPEGAPDRGGIPGHLAHPVPVAHDRDRARAQPVLR